MIKKARQRKNPYSVKRKWYGTNTSIDPDIRGGVRRAEYNIELLKKTKFSIFNSGKYLVIESWGFIGKPSHVSIMRFSSEKKAIQFFDTEVEISIGREYKQRSIRTIRA